LRKLCSALSGTVTCNPGLKAGRFRVTCSVPAG
jgi:hypothetical protein